MCQDREDNEIKAKCLYLLGKTYSKINNSDDNRRIEYLNQSIEIYKTLKLDNQRTEYALCFYEKSICLSWLEKYDESNQNIDKCLKSLDMINCEERADCLMKKCYNHFKLKEFEDSVHNGLSAIEIYRKFKRERSYEVAQCYRWMAESSGYLGAKENFVDYYKNALELFRELEKHQLVAFSLKKLSAAYGQCGKREEQLKYGKESLEKYNSLSFEGWENGEEMASCYTYLADAYRANRDYTRAGEYYYLALSFYTKYEDEINTIRLKMSRNRNISRNPNELNWRMGNLDLN